MAAMVHPMRGGQHFSHSTHFGSNLILQSCQRTDDAGANRNVSGSVASPKRPAADTPPSGMVSFGRTRASQPLASVSSRRPSEAPGWLAPRLPDHHLRRASGIAERPTGAILRLMPQRSPKSWRPSQFQDAHCLQSRIGARKDNRPRSRVPGSRGPLKHVSTLVEGSLRNFLHPAVVRRMASRRAAEAFDEVSAMRIGRTATMAANRRLGLAIPSSRQILGEQMLSCPCQGIRPGRVLDIGWGRLTEESVPMTCVGFETCIRPTLPPSERSRKVWKAGCVTF